MEQARTGSFAHRKTAMFVEMFRLRACGGGFVPFLLIIETTII